MPKAQNTVYRHSQPRRRLSLAGLWCLLWTASVWAQPDTVAAVTQTLRTRYESSLQAPPPDIAGLSLPQATALFYRARQYAPAWLDTGAATALLTELDGLRADGLEPEDYGLRELRERTAQVSQHKADTAWLTQFDVAASQAYLRALAHLYRGKVNPRTLSTEWNFAAPEMATSEAVALANAALDNTSLDKGALHALFERARPQHPFYRGAKMALAQMRAVAATGGWPSLDTKTTLKPGMVDPSVIALRQRLASAGYQIPGETGNPEYDATLAAAVRQFQRDYYLDDDAAVGAATRAALNVPVQARIDQLRVNLERGRWLLHKLESNYLLVDVAGYKVTYFKDSKPLWQASVQVGQPYRATPIFKSKVTHITFNPRWTIPPTILRKDVLPKVRKDLGYLAKNRIRVFNDRGQELNPAQIDWQHPGAIVLRQDAGPDGALGHVAIRFPNPYAVYLHDTPHRELFGKGQRAFSSGCIRVDRPLELVELLLDDPDKWNRAGIDAAIASDITRNVNLVTPVPILLVYWTIDVRADGRVLFKPDIYQRDSAVLAALNKDGSGR